MIYIVTQRDPFFTDSFLYTFKKMGYEFTVLNTPNFNGGFFAGTKKALKLYRPFGFIKLLIVGLYLKFYRIFIKIPVIDFADIQKVNSFLSNALPSDVILSLSAPARIAVENIHPECLKVNIHCGELPKYAGMMPIFWQLYNNEQNITITFHHMSMNIDTGSVISKISLPAEGTLFEISIKAKIVSAQHFAEILSQQKNEPIINRNLPTPSKLSKFPDSSHIFSLRKKRKLI